MSQSPGDGSGWSSTCPLAGSYRPQSGMPDGCTNRTSMRPACAAVTFSARVREVSPFPSRSPYRSKSFFILAWKWGVSTLTALACNSLDERSSGLPGICVSTTCA
jgi:hypothetical protein